MWRGVEEKEERIGERKKRQWEEMRDRAGDAGGRAGTRCGVSAPYCYNMTLTGLCNQTGLAFGSQQTPAALTVI